MSWTKSVTAATPAGRPDRSPPVKCDGCRRVRCVPGGGTFVHRDPETDEGTDGENDRAALQHFGFSSPDRPGARTYGLRGFDVPFVGAGFCTGRRPARAHPETLFPPRRGSGGRQVRPRRSINDTDVTFTDRARRRTLRDVSVRLRASFVARRRGAARRWEGCEPVGDDAARHSDAARFHDRRRRVRSFLEPRYGRRTARKHSRRTRARRSGYRPAVRRSGKPAIAQRAVRRCRLDARDDGHGAQRRPHAPCLRCAVRGPRVATVRARQLFAFLEDVRYDRARPRPRFRHGWRTESRAVRASVRSGRRRGRPALRRRLRTTRDVRRRRLPFVA